MGLERSVLTLAREVFAAALGSVLTRARDGGELIDELPAELRVPVLGPLPAVTLAVANRPQQLFQANPARRRAVFQSRGAGLIAIAGKQEDLAQGTAAGGILLQVGDFFIDEPPHVHPGEWWAVSDVVGTVLIAGEVS